MISGWTKLQLPLGSESHGNGVFTAPPAFMASCISPKEQNFLICRSLGDRGGYDNFSVAELRAPLVRNLVGALIDATEILYGYTHPSGAHGVVNQILGFDASSQDPDVSFASHALRQSELELPFYERLSHGSSACSSFSPSLDNVISGPRDSQQHAHVDHVVLFSSSLDVGGGRKLPVSTRNCSADHGHENINSFSSEEDYLLQEARFKAFRRHMEPYEKKDAKILGDCPDSKRARNASYGQTEGKEGCAERQNAWPLAEIMRLSQQDSLFWGSVMLGMLLAGALIVTCQSLFFKGKQSQKPSVKRRILKSHWYANPGSPAWEHKNAQIKMSEFPKYPLLEVDGDRKLLHFASESAGIAAAVAKRESQPSRKVQTPQNQPIRKLIHGMGEVHEPLLRAHAPQKQPIRRQSIHDIGSGHVSSIKKAQDMGLGHVAPTNKAQDMGVGHVASTNKAQEKPIRQTMHSSKVVFGKHGSIKAQPENKLNRGASANEPSPEIDLHQSPEEEKETSFSQPRALRSLGSMARNGVQNDKPKQRFSRIKPYESTIEQVQWGNDDELDLDRRIQKLYQTIQAVEQHRRTAMLALEEERQRSIALEQEMSKQREAAALLGKEVRLLKESHNALLKSLQKKYSTSAAARTAADLVYQDWERHVAAE